MLLFATRRVRPRIWWIIGATLVVLAGAFVAVLLLTDFDWRGLATAVDALHAAPLLVAMSVLPLLGFPIVPVYLVAGARFGPLAGGAAVALATAVHLLGSFLIARTVLRRPIERWLSKWHTHLPEIPRDEEPAIAVIAVLVPGLPYVVRNYLLAIAGLRLRVCLWVCLPIHVARSYVSILLGDLGMQPDGRRLLILGIVEVVKVVVCGGVIWWLRAHHQRVHGENVAAALLPPNP